MINWNNPITRKLITDFPLIERGGTLTKNIVAKRSSSMSASIVWNFDQIGPKLTFNKTASSIISLGYNPTLSVNNWTFEVWAKPRVAQKTAALFYNGSDTGGYGIFYGDTADGTGSKLVGLIGNITWVDPAITLNSGLIYQMVMMRRSGTIYFYYNGTNETASVTNNPNTPTAATATIGNELGGNDRPYDGDIYSARMWDRALTANEVKSLYTNPWQIYSQPIGPRQVQQPVAAVAASHSTFKALTNAGNI